MIARPPPSPLPRPATTNAVSGRPRVLVVITRSEPGGAQVHVRDLVLGLASRYDIAVAVGDEGFLTEALTAAGIRVFPIAGLQREVAAGSDLVALRSLRALIRQLRPALVHTHSTKAGLLGRLAARSMGVPVIHTAHAWSFSDGIPWSRKGWAIPVEAAAGRLTDRFIVVSAADREVGMRWRVARDAQVRIVHNGVPEGGARAQVQGGDPPVVAMVARMAAPKDHGLLLRAIAQVEAPYSLWLIGDGPERPAVEAEIARLGLADRVRLLGERRDVPALLAQAQIFVLVSRQEGFPLSILEGMRAGLPVIASRVGGVAEAVRPEVTGLLVDRDDQPALRQSLHRLLTDPALRVAMGAAGRADFEAHFTVARMLDATAQVYNELLAAAPAWAARAPALGGAR